MASYTARAVSCRSTAACCRDGVCLGDLPYEECSLLVGDWLEGEFQTRVQKRGAEIIQARGLSSAASAADAIVNHMHDWVLGTPEGDWTSMSVISDGSYGISEGIVFSFPVTCHEGDYEIVQGLELDNLARARLQASEQELLEERAIIEELIPRR